MVRAGIAVALLSLAGCSVPQEDEARASEPMEPRELVLLVHGLGRTERSMRPLCATLEEAGFTARTWGYRSWSADAAEAGDALCDELQLLCADPAVARVHLVGHSLGAILIRHALCAAGPPLPRERLGRVVMLAPPNAGSPVARWLAPLLGGVMKPLCDLSDGDGSAVRAMEAPRGVEIGVIAARWDEKVPVASTHLAGEMDHLVVPGLHGTILVQRDVHAQVIAFLEQGRFARVSGAEPGPRPSPPAGPAR